MSNILNINENKLRPYNMFVLYCSQSDSDAPIVIKTIYNDFKTHPVIRSTTVVSTGYYQIELENGEDLGISNSSKSSVLGLKDISQQVESYLIAYLDTSHTIITIRNYYPPFNSPEIINGTFYLVYTKLKN